MLEETKDAKGLSEEKEEMDKGRWESKIFTHGLGVSSASVEETSLHKQRKTELREYTGARVCGALTSI